MEDFWQSFWECPRCKKSVDNEYARCGLCGTERYEPNEYARCGLCGTERYEPMGVQ